MKSEGAGYGPAGVAICVRGHAYNVSIHELHERAPMTASDVAQWRRENYWKLQSTPDLEPPAVRSVPNGRLKLELPSAWDGTRSSWSEGPRGPLEAKLPAFFAELERRAEADDRAAEQRQRQQELRRQQELEMLEQEQVIRLEQLKVEQLAGEITTWRLAADVRVYVAALRERLAELDDETRVRVGEWCQWAEDWADRRDPVKNPKHVGGV